MKLYQLQTPSAPSKESEERVHVLSHELRTPLAVIRGYAQVLEEELTGEQKSLVAPILENVERLQHVISSLIDWEANASEEKTVRSNCDIRELVDSVVRKNTPLAESKNISINVLSKESKISAYLAAESLRTYVNQLLDNALKFSDSGSVNIELEVSPQHICIRIIDNGPGISAATDRLFEPFVQGSSGLSRTHQGLGLGLALVKKETLRLNGKVTLTNGATSGAIAELRFPRSALNKQENASVETRRIAA